MLKSLEYYQQQDATLQDYLAHLEGEEEIFDYRIDPETNETVGEVEDLIEITDKLILDNKKMFYFLEEYYITEVFDLWAKNQDEQNREWK